MDYVRPVEAVIPGAQGRILAACLRASEPLTMRALARLDELGLVHRQPAGRALLVSLVEDSPVVEALRQVADLRRLTLDRWREAAGSLRPQPGTLAVYGSWARGDAGPTSDVDVLVVLPRGLSADAEDDYREQIGAWCAHAGRVCGLPVAPLIVTVEEAAALRRKLARQIRRDAVVIVGASPRAVLDAAALPVG
jgi:hypothetical protein